MDCSICTSYPLPVRPPRNTICAACHEGITSAMSFIGSASSSDSKTGHMDDVTSKHHRPTTPAARPSKGSPSSRLKRRESVVNCAAFDALLFCPLPQGAARLPGMLKRMKDSEEELMERINFLANSVTAFRDKIHTDIRIKAGDGPPISAHRAILSSRSEVFRNMLDADSCKSSPENDAVMIPELTHEELESLMEFLYSGSLAHGNLDKHVYSLTLAADKYVIPYLQKLCERHMLCSLSTSNALDVLEVSTTCSNEKLKDAAMEFVVKNVKDIAFTGEFEEFCRENPHLVVQITRACLTKL